MNLKKKREGFFGGEVKGKRKVEKIGGAHAKLVHFPFFRRRGGGAPPHRNQTREEQASNGEKGHQK